MFAARIVGDAQNLRNETTPIPSEASWSHANHPVILGQLDPFQIRSAITKQAYPVPFLVEDGQVIHDAHDRPIQDFPFLPRYISSDVEFFRIEAYFRMDPRLTYHDLWARMPAATPYFDSVKVRNIGNMIARHVRKRNNARCWDAKGHQLPRRNIELVESLSPEQMRLNTTWIVEENGIRQPGSAVLLPRDIFLEPGKDVHELSEIMLSAINELARLDAIARERGEANWRDVPDAHPPTWMARRRKSVRAREEEETVSLKQEEDESEEETDAEFANDDFENSVLHSGSGEDDKKTKSNTAGSEITLKEDNAMYPREDEDAEQEEDAKQEGDAEQVDECNTRSRKRRGSEEDDEKLKKEDIPSEISPQEVTEDDRW